MGLRAELVLCQIFHVHVLHVVEWQHCHVHCWVMVLKDRAKRFPPCCRHLAVHNGPCVTVMSMQGSSVLADLCQISRYLTSLLHCDVQFCAVWRYSFVRCGCTAVCCQIVRLYAMRLYTCVQPQCIICVNRLYSFGQSDPGAVGNPLCKFEFYTLISCLENGHWDWALPCIVMVQLCAASLCRSMLSDCTVVPSFIAYISVYTLIVQW